MKYRGITVNWSKGFTIVELAVVILAIAILATILIPNIQAIREEAKVSRASADLATLQLAIESYISAESSLPASLSTLLTVDSASRMVNKIPEDPFSPDSDKYEYLVTSDMSSYGPYVVFSVGKNGIAEITLADFETDEILTVNEAGDDIYVTNLRQE